MTSVPDQLTLTINGRAYSGWTAVRVSRGIDRCATDFDIEVTDRWAGQPTPWQIQPFNVCSVAIGKDAVLTGYVDDYLPSYGPEQHQVRIRGRSKTADLIDSTPDIQSGQFSGYSLAAIATGIAKLFGISVVVQTAGASTIFANAMLERGETAFTFLERLGRLAGVLLTDDEQGRLVLTNAGATQAAGRLLEGDNIQSATAVLSGAGRHSAFIVKGQAGLYSGAPEWAGFGGGYEPGGSLPPPPASTVQTQLEATATDPAVPRFRPRVVVAEGEMTLQQMQLRANWLRQQSIGAGTRADVVVKGWRQPDGTLWRINQIVAVTSPMLGVDQDLLVARVDYQLSLGDGATTRLRVAPVGAYTPDPGQVRIHKTKGAKGGAPAWAGFGSGT